MHPGLHLGAFLFRTDVRTDACPIESAFVRVESVLDLAHHALLGPEGR